MLRGYSNRRIAAELLLAEPTIATHIRHILAKSRTANRAEAAVWAVRNGLD
jgi:DNA-binding NarL/FixJ family response regulator